MKDDIETDINRWWLLVMGFRETTKLAYPEKFQYAENVDSETLINTIFWHRGIEK